MISTAIIMSALELGCVYALVALALFLSFRTLNIADMTTDGAFTLGCACLLYTSDAADESLPV